MKPCFVLITQAFVVVFLTKTLHLLNWFWFGVSCRKSCCFATQLTAQPAKTKSDIPKKSSYCYLPYWYKIASYKCATQICQFGLGFSLHGEAVFNYTSTSVPSMHQAILFTEYTDRNFVDNFLKVVIHLALVANIQRETWKKIVLQVNCYTLKQFCQF